MNCHRSIKQKNTQKENKMKKKNLLLILLVLIGGYIVAQNDSCNTRIGQITFNYPLGSNGFNSYNYSNNFSLNLLVGLNGGVEGVEFGGLGNINNGDVNGAQFGGLFNINKGTVNGAQLGGTFNMNTGNTFGGQFSGLANINAADMDGIQVAGLLNVNKGSIKHVQIAGLMNSNYGNASGVQIAGIINSNLNKPNKQNSQLVQISGIMNENAASMTGAQISPVLNIAADTLIGVQIGLINIGTYIEGSQIGLINICTNDSSKVAPLGLLNFVTGGVWELELAAEDLIYSNLNLKLGAKKLYTIFKIGYSVNNNQSVFSYGFGLGRYFELNDKNRISLDLSTSNFSDIFLMTSRFDFLNKLDLAYKRSISNNFSVFVGPSFNLYLTEDFGQGEKPLLKPLYTISKTDFNRGTMYSWVGAKAGISFNF